MRSLLATIIACISLATAARGQQILEPSAEELGVVVSCPQDSKRCWAFLHPHHLTGIPEWIVTEYARLQRCFGKSGAPLNEIQLWSVDKLWLFPLQSDEIWQHAWGVFIWNLDPPAYQLIVERVDTPQKALTIIGHELAHAVILDPDFDHESAVWKRCVETLP
jgi:hypothetical protein